MMSKQILRLVAIVVALLIFTVPTFAQTGDTFRVMAQTLNARTGPGIEYDVIAQLGRGAEYPIVAYSPTRNWVLLDLGFAQAWSFRHLGEVISPVVVTVIETTPTNVDPTLGQGGGVVVPTIVYTNQNVTETGVDLSVTITQEEFNSTLGVISNVRIRIEPTFESRIISFIRYGDRATVLGRNFNGTWIQVDADGVVGWVYFRNVILPPAIDVVALPITG